MEQYSEVEFTLDYADDNQKKITLGPLAQNAASLANLKSNVKAFNQNFNSDTAKLSLSQYGFEWEGISRVRIIETTKIEIE